MSARSTPPAPDPADPPLGGLAAARRLVGALEGAEAPEAGLPAVIGYVVQERIGEGGGGEVYRAVRAGSDRPVAIKILSRRLGEGKAAQRAWRELDLLSQLHVPSVPRVLDYGLTDGRLYIVTEYVAGLALDEHCNSRVLDRRGRAALLARVAEAVHALHEHGVIHRDLKPGNILIDRHGDPVIIDLGLAMVAGGDAGLSITADGAPLGSPAFMAPEQARGDRGGVSTRTDVYGLGATACVVLTGQTPHELGAPGERAGLADVVHRVAYEPARDPRALDPTMPRALAAVVSKALSGLPGDRYASAAALATDLRRWLDGEPVLAQPPGRWTRMTRWIGRHPVLTTAGACGVMVAGTLAATTVLVRWFNREPYGFFKEPDSAQVHLRARSGRNLRTFTLQTAGSGWLGRIVERPRSMGGGRVAVTYLQGPAGEEWANNQLCIWDPDDMSRPLATAPTTAPEIVRPTRAEPDDSFFVMHASIEDIFPEREGLEIVACHHHREDATISIRVYDLQMQVLFEAWHEGMIDPVVWLPKAGLMAFAGYSNDPRWEALGWNAETAEGTARGWPRTYFAVRAEMGARHGLLDAESLGRPGAYTWRYFPHVTPEFESRRVTPGMSHLARAFNERTEALIGRAARVAYEVDGRSVSWSIGPDGSVQGPFPNDEFVARYGEPEGFSLGTQPQRWRK